VSTSGYFETRHDIKAEKRASTTLKVHDLEFERVREFKYLGSTPTENNNNVTTEIQYKTVMTIEASYCLKNHKMYSL
jgi:hypothetical protein